MRKRMREEAPCRAGVAVAASTRMLLPTSKGVSACAAERLESNASTISRKENVSFSLVGIASFLSIFLLKRRRPIGRTEEHSVGKECVSTCRTGRGQDK